MPLTTGVWLRLDRSGRTEPANEPIHAGDTDVEDIGKFIPGRVLALPRGDDARAEIDGERCRHVE